jgi:hypothetical protein
MADVTVEFGALDTGLEKTLKAVQDELTQLKGKVSSGELSMTELESTMKRIGQVTTMEKNIKAIGDQSTATSPKVEELNVDIKKTGDNSEDAGKKAGAGFGQIAIGAGIAGAAVKLGTAAIDAAFAAAQKTVQSFGDALNMGGRLAELSDRTGVAVDQLLILERAFQNTGIGADSLGPIINKMQKAIADAGDGSSKAADAFTKLGIPLSELENLSPDEQLRAIGKAIAGIPDPAERASISMEIFGKSGGALNQVFANMDGELETAKAQLGSLPEVMKAGAAQFDKISDNLTVIGGKFVEFAAGIIDKVKPALDALTTALTRIDATKLGQDLAGFFTGAGAGMQGFQAAVDAIDAGDMGTAFKIVAQAIQIQFKETGNSIYASMVAAFKTAGEFAAKIFDPSGALSQTILMSFDLLANKAGASIMSGLAKAFDGSYLTRGIADSLREMAGQATETAKIAEEGLKGAGSRIAKQFTETGKALPESFKENMAGVPPLFTGIEEHQKEIDHLQQSITRSTKETTAAISDQAKEDAKAEQEARKYFQDHKKFQEDQAKANAKKTADQEAANKLKQEELGFQLKFAEAQAAGDTEHMATLTAQKEWLANYQKALAAGLGEEQAQNFANRMADAANASKNIVYTDKDGHPLFFKAAEMAAKLGDNLKSATGFADTLAQMKGITALEKANNSAKAAKEELKAMDQLLGTDLAQKSFPDLAKKLGVDKIGQTGEQQIKAVVAYLNQVKTDLSKNPLDSDKAKATIEKIRTDLKAPFNGTLNVDYTKAKKSTDDAFSKVGTTLNVDYNKAKTATDTAFSSVPTILDADKSVKDLRDSVKDGIELDVAAKSGVSGLLDAIKTAVEAIKTSVLAIEPKLPTAALI